MGRGNICTHNEYEGLYYLDRGLIDVYYYTGGALDCNCTDECSCYENRYAFNDEMATKAELDDAGIEYSFDGKRTGWAFDEWESKLKYDDMIETVCSQMITRFPSFSRRNAWQGYDRKVVLSNGLFNIAVADNAWSYAWMLLENEEARYDGRNNGLMARHWQAYLEAIKKVLVETWGEAIGYGGAWTSGKKYTKEILA